MSSSPQLTKHKRIIIVGGGFGGAYCARRLQKALKRRKDVEVLLIDRRNYMVFTPLLVEAGTGNLEPRHAVVPLREFIGEAEFLMGEVTHIDTESQIVHCTITGTNYKRSFHYDHLVLAPGSVTRLPEVPGLREYAFQMKNIIDSVALRDRCIQMLEIANNVGSQELRRSLLHFVVVGANYTGVELAGEYLMFLREITGKFRNVGKKDIQVSLVELGPRILPALDPELSDFASKVLQDRGTTIYLNSTLIEIRAREVVLSGGRTIPCHTVVWTAGIAPAPLLATLPFEKDQRGYLRCETNLRVKGQVNVWAIGDSANNPAPGGEPYPPTAQHATRQGLHLADNLLRVMRGEDPVPCKIDSLGSLAAIGCRTGVAKVFGFKLSGFAAWFLWRTVYLMKMPTWARRIRVALDWSLDLVLRPDIVQLGIHRVRVEEPLAKLDEGRSLAAVGAEKKVEPRIEVLT